MRTALRSMPRHAHEEATPFLRNGQSDTMSIIFIKSNLHNNATALEGDPVTRGRPHRSVPGRGYEAFPISLLHVNILCHFKP